MAKSIDDVATTGDYPTEDEHSKEGSHLPDTTLTCSDCSCQFTFTEGEQEFFQTKGFTPPTRCPDCRRRRKAEKMDGGGSGGSGFGGGGGGRGRSRGW